MENRINRLRRIGREHGIALARHPERDLYPVLAADVPRWEKAIEADADKARARLAAEDAQMRAALGKTPTCVAPVSDDVDPRLCGARATAERTVEGLVCPLCAEHAAEIDADKA